MKRIVWSTDIHLNFLDPSPRDDYLQQLVDAAPDGVVISGDIADSRSLVPCLIELDDRLPCPLYFVLGNHDFYHSSIAKVRQQVRQLCAERETLVYLPDTPHVELSAATGLAGTDGWADARIGDYERSMVMMNDYRLIEEFVGLGKQERWPVLKALGDEAAASVRRVLPRALERYDQVFFVTHVPPLREACWYNGRISNDEWAPHFTCKAVGDALLEIARAYPERQLTVLCGHTHSPGEYWPLPQVRVITGGAEYGFPTINDRFHV